MLMPGQFTRGNQENFINSESGAEIVRQMRQERLVTETMDGLFNEYPNLTQARRVLDIYCGPGGWVLELAFYYPDITVIGIDKSRNMVDYARAQASVQGLDNASFLVMDPARGLNFPDASFDIVNARFIAWFLTRDDWPSVVRELVRVTRPGGLVRLIECDEPGLSNSEGHERMKRLYLRAAVLSHRSFASSPNNSGLAITPMLRPLLAQAGCQHIQEKPYVLDYSAGSEAAISSYENLKILYKLGQPFLISLGLATQQELDAIYEQMLIDMLSDTFRALWYFLCVCGQKPL